VGFIAFCKWAYKTKTSDFIGWVQLRKNKDNYGRLIDFLPNFKTVHFQHA